MDSLNIQQIKNDIKTQYFGNKIIYFQEIDSTNTYAKKISKESTNGTVVISEMQLNGRGRQGNKWDSQYGQGLWMSLILKSPISTEDIIKITSVIGLGIKNGLEKLIESDVYIKWPNDIILNNKKICGILVESVISGQKVDSLIVGIGINVNQSKSYFKDLPHASSINIETKNKIDREDVFVSIMEALEKEFNKFIQNKTIDIKELEKSSILFNRQVRVIAKDEKELRGKVVGFLGDGSILIKDDKGNELNFKTSDISIRGINSYI